MGNSQQSMEQQTFEIIQKAQAEKDNKDGVYLADLIKYNFLEILPRPSLFTRHLPPSVFIGNLMLESKVYINSDVTKLSLIPLDGYFKWNEYLAIHFKGYSQIGQEGLKVQNAPTLNFDDVVDILLTKDFQNSEKVNNFDEMTQGGYSYFLDQKSKVPQVLFSSFPRSGNSMMRGILEKATGVVTGSNMEINSLNLGLLVQGLKGENIVDQRCWILKTHAPISFPTNHKTKGSRTFVIVRNPFDTFTSFWQFINTQTHNKSMSNDFLKEFPDAWDMYIKTIGKQYSNFFNYWIEAGQKRKIPVYFIRFEDVLANKQKWVKELMEFILGVESLSGTYLEKRIETQLDSQFKVNGYIPRSGKSNKGVQYFNDELKKLVLDSCRSTLNYFGYTRFQGQEVTEINESFLFEGSPKEIKEQNAWIDLNKQLKQWSIEDKQKIEQQSLNDLSFGKIMYPHQLMSMDVIEKTKDKIRID